MPINPFGTSAWDNAGLKFPALFQEIVDTPIEGFDMRTLLQYKKVENNNRVVIPRLNGASTAVVSRVGEGDEPPNQIEPFTGQEIICYKIGEQYKVSWEMVQYQQIDAVETMFKRLAHKFFHTVNVDIMTTIGAGVPVANTIAATGTSLFYDGTVGTLAGTVGQYDITQGKRVLSENFKAVTEGNVVLLCNPIGLNMLENLPHFSSKNMSGYEGYVKGLRGTIYGAQIIMSNDVPAGEMYLLATSPLTYRTMQYTPIGFFIDVRPLDVYTAVLPWNDGVGVYAYQIYGCGIVYGEGTVKITYSGFS